MELWARMVSGNFAEMTIWDRRLYCPSEGRRAEDFFALKNPTASAGFEPANLGTKGQHATARPPKPIMCHIYIKFKIKFSVAESLLSYSVTLGPVIELQQI